MIVSTASNNDISELSTLWQICFGDTEQYISAFMEDCFEPRNTVTVRENGVICSALYLLRGRVRISGEYFTAAYLYAACTHPDYRSKGFMGKALRFAEKLCADEGLDYICLVPAEDSLFDYYSSFGYVSAFEEKRLCVNRKQLELLSNGSACVDVPSAEDVALVYSDMLMGNDCFVWDIPELCYAMKENKNAECKSVAAFVDGRCTAYALFDEEDGTLLVRECASMHGCFSDLAAALLTKSDCESFSFRLPLGFPLSADNFEVSHNAMLLPLSKEAKAALKHIKNAYMGFTLG